MLLKTKQGNETISCQGKAECSQNYTDASSLSHTVPRAPRNGTESVTTMIHSATQVPMMLSHQVGEMKPSMETCSMQRLVAFVTVENALVKIKPCSAH